jgi:ATPase subunit of ABC transporter with duplicated ATPase domains
LILSQTSTAYCEKLLSIAQNDASRLEELQGHIERLKKGVEVEQIGAEACDQLRRLLGLQEDALAAIYQQRILKSIRFDSMHERDDRVYLPHESTFEWLLEDNEPADQKDPQPAQNKMEEEEIIAMKLKSRTIFLNWLSSPEGIFHISGKLGSGKSTLMKLLSTHPHTRTQLQKWAG